jgi:hypothetical protein
LIIVGVQYYSIDHVDNKRTPDVAHEELSEIVDSDKDVQLNKLVAANEAVYELGKLVVAINLYLAINIYLPYSLTKYSAIFAEVKGYFGISNNQLRCGIK